jgi:hypothetical protein
MRYSLSKATDSGDGKHDNQSTFDSQMVTNSPYDASCGGKVASRDTVDRSRRRLARL